MATDNSGDLSAFHQFVGSRLAVGTNLTPEEAVEEWRALHPSDEDAAELEAAIQEALNDMNAGKVGRPFEEFNREFKRLNGLD